MLSVNFVRLSDSANQKFLIAASAGVDSMVLCRVLNNRNIPFDMAHCNYQLRKESNTEQRFVEKMADVYESKCHVQIFNTKEILENDKRSVQELTRDLRYNWFDTLIKDHGYTHILTAHHKDDSRETFFINLLRGSSVIGLKGINYQNGSIVRPFIEVTKSDILEYAKANKVQYLEDSSNAEDGYLRNRIRHQVIPNLEKASDNGLKGFDLSLELLKRNAEFLQLVADNWCNQFARYSSGKATFEKIGLSMYKDQLDVLLHLILRPYHFNRSQINDLAQCVFSNRGRFLSPTHELVVTQNELVVYSTEDEHIENEILLQTTGEYLLEDGSFFSCQEIVDVNISAQVHGSEIIDAEKIKFPLTIRPWKPGERMMPLGMEGSQKKIKDVLTDAKINSFEKRKTLVLVDARGEVVWLIKHRLSELFKIDSGSTRFLQLFFEQK